VNGPAYAAARIAAPRVADHFNRHCQLARTEGRQRIAPVPPVPVIEALIDAAFWASLRREEGYEPRISLAWVAAHHVPRPLRFAAPLPLTAEALTRMAAAVERPGIHLGAWSDGGRLSVWGTTRRVPPFCFVLEVAGPGLLVVKDGRREGTGKFVNVAVLEGDAVKILDERAVQLAESPAVLMTLLGFDPPGNDTEDDAVDVLAQLAISMRRHGRGGSLVLVPADAGWRESVLSPIPYPVLPPFSELAELMRRAPRERRGAWRSAVRRAVDMIAGLTAVDGATLLTRDYDLLAFGATLARADGSPPVERVLLAEPVEGAGEIVVGASQLGGTRHQSAAQFVQDRRDAQALVASKDGRFTIFAWSRQHEMVHAYRVEALLL
jgi:hypothetical protein